jgi:hypothetical protein
MWNIDLAGDSVAVGSYAAIKDESGNDINALAVYVIAPDGGVREVLHVDDPTGWGELGFAAGPSELAYYASKGRQPVITGNTAFGFGTQPTERILGVGPVDGPFQRIQDCGQGDAFIPPAVDGPVAAWSGADCAADTILVRDGRPGAVAERKIPSGDNPPMVLAVGGRFVAWISISGDPRQAVDPVPTALHVYDLDKGSVAYTKTLRGLYSLSVDGQGNAALARLVIPGAPADHPGCDIRVMRTSVAHPSGRYLKSLACDPYVVAANGQVAVLQAAGRGHEELRVLDANDRVTAPVARFPHTEYDYDFDGNRVAWTEQSCRYETAYSVPARGPASSRPAPCRITVGPARLVTAAGHRSVRVRVNCRAGCHGELTVDLRRSTASHPVAFDVPPRASRDVTVLKNTPHRWRRGRRLRLSVFRLPETRTEPPPFTVARTLR